MIKFLMSPPDSKNLGFFMKSTTVCWSQAPNIWVNGNKIYLLTPDSLMGFESKAKLNVSLCNLKFHVEIMHLLSLNPPAHRKFISSHWFQFKIDILQ